MTIQLVAFDLDGTLMGEDLKICAPVRAAIAEAQAHGIIITLATGRLFASTLPFAKILGIKAPLICYQGGWIQAPGDTEPRHRESLPDAITRSVLALAEAYGWHTVFYADGHPFIRETPYDIDFYDALLGESTVEETWDAVLDRHTPDKILFVAQPDEIPPIAQKLRQHLDGKADVVQSHAHFIEVVPKDVSKAKALAWLANDLGIPREAVMAVGDQENDLAMVRWAGIGVAMGNAISQVQRAAHWIAPPLEQDGAVVALERFVLKGKGSSDSSGFGEGAGEANE